MTNGAGIGGEARKPWCRRFNPVPATISFHRGKRRVVGTVTEWSPRLYNPPERRRAIRRSRPVARIAESLNGHRVNQLERGSMTSRLPCEGGGRGNGRAVIPLGGGPKFVDDGARGRLASDAGRRVLDAVAEAIIE